MPEKVPLPDEKLYKYSFFKTGTRIFNQGDIGTDIYILKKGAVTVSVDNQLVGLINTPDSIIGEMAYFLGIQRTATIEAVEDSEFIVIPGKNLYDIVMKKPEIGIGFLKTLTRRLANTTKYATRLEKDTIELRGELRKLKGIADDHKPSFEEELILHGFISEKELAECREEFEKLKEKGETPSLLKIIVEKNHIKIEQILQLLEL